MNVIRYPADLESDTAQAPDRSAEVRIQSGADLSIDPRSAVSGAENDVVEKLCVALSHDIKHNGRADLFARLPVARQKAAGSTAGINTNRDPGLRPGLNSHARPKAAGSIVPATPSPLENGEFNCRGELPASR